MPLHPRPQGHDDRPLAHRWAGWARPSGGRWEKVCEAGSYGDCWSQLLNIVTSKAVDKTVLPLGQSPDAGRRP